MHFPSNHPTGTPRQGRHGRRPIIWRMLAVAALGLALAIPSRVQAKTFHCPAGDVACLIAAMHAANAAPDEDTIRLAAGTYRLTAVDNMTGGANGLPSVTTPIRIVGRGMDRTTLERGGALSFRLLHVASSGNLMLQGLTVQGGFSSVGGGLLNAGGQVTIRRARFRGNSAIGGGAISHGGGTLLITGSRLEGNDVRLAGGAVFIANGIAEIVQTTMEGNQSDGATVAVESGSPENPASLLIHDSTILANGARGTGPGGISNAGTLVVINTTLARNVSLLVTGALTNGGTALIINSTIAENVAASTAFPGISGGLANQSGATMLLINTLVAQNTLAGEPSDCAGPITSGGSNLIEDPTGCAITLQPTDLTGDPGLGEFTDDGTPGNGHFPLLPGSPAIDAGNDAVCPRRDQLRARRVGACDIGSIEFRDQDDRVAGDQGPSD